MKRLKNIKLPSKTVILKWIIVFVVITILSTIIIVYSQTFSKMKTIIAITSILLTLILELTVLQFLKGLIKSLYELWRKKTSHFDFKEYPKFKETNLNNLSKIKQKCDELKIRICLEKLDFIKEKEICDSHFRELISELFRFSFYLVILLTIVLGSRDFTAFYSTRNVRNLFEESKFYSFSMRGVNNDQDFISYLNDSFLPIIHLNEMGWLPEKFMKIIGVPRLRQLRVTSQYNSEGVWYPEYSSQYQDYSNYNTMWRGEVDFKWKKQFWRTLSPFTYQSGKSIFY